MVEFLKLFITHLGTKRSFRIVGTALVVTTSFVVLVQLDLVDWTFYWVVPSLVALHLAIEVLLAAASTDNEKNKGNEKKQTTRPKKNK